MVIVLSVGLLVVPILAGSLRFTFTASVDKSGGWESAVVFGPPCAPFPRCAGVYWRQ